VTSFLAREMAKRHEVTVLTSHGPDVSLERVEHGVRIVRVPVFFRKNREVANVLSLLTFIPMAIRVGRKVIKLNQYDLVNTHFVLPTGPVGDDLAEFGGIPNVLTLHGGDLFDPSKFMSPHRNPLLRAWIRRLLRRADVVVGNSNNTLKNMRRYYTPEIEGIRIALGITGLKVEAANRTNYGCKEEEILMVTVGRLIARKAISQLISMMGGLTDENVRLLIIGTGPEEQFLREQCDKMHLGNKILFLGPVEESEKFRILNMCDIYVSKSQHEGFGLVFLEAMQCGLPIVCYDHGGQTDFLRDQETGYIISLNDIDLFKQRCEFLIRNPNLRKRFGENNRLRVKEYYIDNCVSKYENLFSSIISKNKGQWF
jgi:glycosyltransferase involved in cell wall biosynthesis